MTAYILVLWTVVAAYDARGVSKHEYYDWRPIGEFASKELCEDGARQLGVKAEKFRCVRTK